MKYFFFNCFILLSFALSAQKPEKLQVITHNQITINTNQKTGNNAFTAWGVFPNKSVPVRRIKMHITLAHPDTMPIAHWDYLDKITIRRAGGKNGKPINFELGRMLTPYGSSFNKTWQWTWTTDVTDFEQYLRDSVEIEYNHSGYEPETVGWKLTVAFEILKAQPVAKIISVSELFNNQYRYGDSLNPIEKTLLPAEIEVFQPNSMGKIRIQHTGHGMDTPKGCSEFCSRWREIRFDNTLIDHRNMWKDCGSNALYPQGGTWLYDRAYWCPGDLQTPDVFNFPVTAGKHTVSITMEPYKATDNVQAGENLAAYFIQTEMPLAANDVALEEISVPSNDKRFKRLNPACFEPRIRIKNLGRNDLKTLQINYGTKGFKPQSFLWKGLLKFGDELEIALPGSINYYEGDNEFTVELTKPNGKTDEWQGDNSAISIFTSPKILPEKMVVIYKTNNFPGENKLYIINAKGEKVYERKAENCLPNTTYLDTINLPQNNYEMFLTDSAGNGLEFWAEPENGYGFLRLLDLNNQIIHGFESDCGDGQFLAFSTSATAKTDQMAEQFVFMIYPRRTKESIELNAFLAKPSSVLVQFLENGVLVEKHEYQSMKEGKFNYNISNLKKGRYVVEIYVNGALVYKNRINKD